MKEENIFPFVGVIDHEKECEDLRAENKKLKADNDKLAAESLYLQSVVSTTTRENEILRAQLDIIHLIYGGNRNG